MKRPLSLASRPGPSTGVPTYTEQADLPAIALATAISASSPPRHRRGVLLPYCRPLDLAWRFPVAHHSADREAPHRVLHERNADAARAAWAQGDVPGHEGDYKRYPTVRQTRPAPSAPSESSREQHEHDEVGITTDEPGPIAAMHDKRQRTSPSLNTCGHPYRKLPATAALSLTTAPAP